MKTFSFLPCCYFPSRVVLVDDVQEFAGALALSLPHQTKIFTKSLEALDYLTHYQPQIKEDIWLKIDNASDLADGSHMQPLMIDVAAVKSIQTADYTQDISVLILDYNMPDLDGLSLLKRLPPKKFKTILLTGELDHALAVEAFNSGLIDYFLRKDEIGTGKIICEAVKKLQQEYFYDMCRKSHEVLKTKLNIFSDIEVGECFGRILKEYNIKEFYLINMHGNYLLLDDKKTKYYFCAYTETELKAFAKHATQDKADHEIIVALEECKKIPFFGEERKFWEIEARLWNSYLYPAEILKTSGNTFFYNIIND